MKNKTRNILAIALILVFLALHIYGAVYTDEMEIVFRKAAKICLECIGIG